MSMELGVSLFAAFINLIAIIVAVYRLGRAVERFESIGNQQSTEIRELKEAVKVVGELITKMALQNQRLDTHAQRLNRIEEIIDELRKGEGMIMAGLKSKGN